MLAVRRCPRLLQQPWAIQQVSPLYLRLPNLCRTIISVLMACCTRPRLQLSRGTSAEIQATCDSRAAVTYRTSRKSRLQLYESCICSVQECRAEARVHDKSGGRMTCHPCEFSDIHPGIQPVLTPKFAAADDLSSDTAPAPLHVHSRALLCISNQQRQSGCLSCCKLQGVVLYSRQRRKRSLHAPVRYTHAYKSLIDRRSRCTQTHVG